MKIAGFQKMTLLDFPGKVACTVFAEGCNLRCPFCHNAGLVTKIDEDAEIKEEEILDFLKKRVGLLDGVCVTGGEPLLQVGVEDFLRKIRKMGYAVKLDTNGSFPDRLKRIVEEGLVDYVAIDVKNRMEKYGETVGIPSFSTEKIEESIDFLLSGKVDYEFRTTVVAEFHTEEDIEAIAKRIRGAKRYFLQNFVDSGNLIGSDLHAVSKEVLQGMKARAKRVLPEVGVRGI